MGNLKADHATEWILKQNTTYLCTDRIELVLGAGLNLPTPTNGSEDPRCILLLKSVVIELTSKPSSCRRSSSLKQKQKTVKPTVKHAYDFQINRKSKVINTLNLVEQQGIKPSNSIWYWLDTQLTLCMHKTK